MAILVREPPKIGKENWSLEQILQSLITRFVKQLTCLLGIQILAGIQPQEQCRFHRFCRAHKPVGG